MSKSFWKNGGMKIGFLLLAAVLFAVPVTSRAVAVPDTVQTQESELCKALKSLKGVVSVEPMDNEVETFSEKYKVRILQPVDHQNPSAGTFVQTFVVSHAGFDRPVVFVTDGYTAGFAFSPKYQDEQTKHFRANQVVVQHRFFDESTPEGRPWQYMTGYNAACDMHNINRQLREIYKGKFVTTGISKGGQNVMIYKTYFPDDADLSVPYVGPLCWGVEDGRHEPFIAKCGTQEDRRRIYEFQREALLRRPAMVAMLDSLTRAKGYTYEGGLTLDNVLDFCVLEASFALWQWGLPTDSLPGKASSDKAIFDKLMSIAGADYIANDGDGAPFFVQAAKELGYYGYDTKPFKGLLSIDSAKGYLHRIFLPEEAKDIVFDKTLYNDMHEYLKKNDPKMLFVYGQYDPWTAPAPEDKLFKGKRNMVKFVVPNGSHSSRIGSMPEEMRQRAWEILDGWMAE